MKSIELKSSLAFKGIIDDYVKYLAKGTWCLNISPFAEKDHHKRSDAEIFAALDHSDTLSNRIEQTGNGCCSS
ncbi:hypothetical protein PO124_21500 [Bacillus licheniformis]|nr:hypothetical protein [Bacillus licheniformis]